MKISSKFVPRGPINNIQAFVQIIAIRKSSILTYLVKKFAFVAAALQQNILLLKYYSNN